MATEKPRITVTLTPSAHAVLTRLAALTKQSQSGIVGDMVEQAEPLFERTVRLLEAANIAKQQARDKALDGMAAAQELIERQLGLMESDLAGRAKDMLDEAEAVSRRGPARRAAAALPTPPSNRGVTSGPQGGKGRQARQAQEAASKGRKRG